MQILHHLSIDPELNLCMLRPLHVDGIIKSWRNHQMKRQSAVGSNSLFFSCFYALLLAISVSQFLFFSHCMAESGTDMNAVQSSAHTSQTVEPDSAQGDSEELDDLDDLEGWDDLEEPADIWDPLETFNRYMFTFNDRLYFWGVKPVATVYSHIMPEPLRESINNGWQNLAAPVRIANCLLQLNFKGAGVATARFFINTIMGIGGLGDPASRMFDLQPVYEDTGQTLGVWGVGFGPYLVLPFIGPSCPRDAIGLAGDSYLYPLNYFVGKFWQNAAMRAGKEVNLRSLRLGEYEDFKASSLDPYIAVRSAYYQYRQNAINETSTVNRFKTFTAQ